MITPFTLEHQVDYDAMAALIEYYVSNGCDGIFALCLSSEIFHLSDREMREIMRFIAWQNKGRLSLIASAHTAPDLETQIQQLRDVYENGAEKAVLILNRLAMPSESEDVVKRSAEAIFNALPDVEFGIYECPYPYKRIASDELLRWFAKTGRVSFLKDTCCDLERIRRRLSLLQGTGLKLYNANSATLLHSLRAGAAGFSGIMANFHADLYARRYQMYRENDPAADDLQAFLTLAATVEGKLYPINCKYHLRHLGIRATIVTRNQDMGRWCPLLESETHDLARMEALVRRQFLRA